jgi:hypothetical protein
MKMPKLLILMLSVAACSASDEDSAAVAPGPCNECVITVEQVLTIGDAGTN